MWKVNHSPMSIQRVPSVPFTQIANSALRDKRLSFKARGLLALVLSNVGEWNATLNWLVAQSDHDGKASVQAALNELTEHGYRIVSREQDKKSGDIRTVVTWHHVPESPISRPTGNPTVENPDHRETGGSIEHHPSEQHLTEQQGQQTPGDPFDDFWIAYPRKDGKQPARKAFTKAAKKMGTEFLIRAVVEYRQWCERSGQERQFIPHASTWLNQERWDDERPEPSKDSNTLGHIALVRELWENEHVENPRNTQLEG